MKHLCVNPRQVWGEGPFFYLHIKYVYLILATGNSRRVRRGTLLNKNYLQISVLQQHAMPAFTYFLSITSLCSVHYSRTPFSSVHCISMWQRRQCAARRRLYVYGSVLTYLLCTYFKTDRPKMDLFSWPMNSNWKMYGVHLLNNLILSSIPLDLNVKKITIWKIT